MTPSHLILKASRGQGILCASFWSHFGHTVSASWKRKRKDRRETSSFSHHAQEGIWPSCSHGKELSPLSSLMQGQRNLTDPPCNCACMEAEGVAEVSRTLGLPNQFAAGHLCFVSFTVTVRLYPVASAASANHRCFGVLSRTCSQR